MYYFFPLLCGAIASVMLTVNGMLTASLGGYSATVLIHMAGLLLVLVLLAVRREKVRLFPAGIPWKEYLGGVIGVATVVTSNLGFGGVSVSAMVALSLLGQTIASVVIDEFGLLGMPKRPFRRELLAGYVFVVLGILVMLLPFGDSRISAVFLLLAGGVTIVLSRTVNGQITERVGVMQSTLYNYITGLATSIVVMLLIGRGEPVWQGAPLPKNLLLYLGGWMGVCTVVLSNICVHRISAVYMTLLHFVGQVMAGILVDTVLDGGIAWRNVAGGACIAFGLLLNILIEQKKEKKKPV